jgi:gamma-glutamylcyclotransferase (GGCT)/AIG2-like uncharacterized protein YtfP
MDRPLGRQCTICNHPQRGEIDKALVAGVAYRRIAAEYGVSDGSLRRHKKNGHIAEQIAKVAKKKEIQQAKEVRAAILAQEAQEVADAQTILDEVSRLKGRALTILDRAETEGTREACMALREVRGIVELLAKVRGELKGDGPTINIIQNPQFVEFKSVVLEVMCDECRERLTRELHRIVGK